jgi:hypothetical protein
MISVDGYTDVERVGRGGLGDVYRAIRTSTGGTVAIKVLRDVSDGSVAWHRTRRELTALVSLAGHANVIQLFEVLDLLEGPALVMEYAPGGSVAELMLRRDRPLSVGETVLVGRQTAAALDAAHAQGIVHRDVKPQNLLIDAYGQVKLCDFGIAAMARTEDFQARTSAISTRYASPEDLDDDAAVGPPSDVYSLGATMLHMVHGAPPSLKERLVPWEPAPTDDVQLAMLDRVIVACLQPLPRDRPPAADVVDELERLGWSIDERNRGLAFVEIDEPVATDEEPTRPRRGAIGGRTGSTVSEMIATLDADADADAATTEPRVRSAVPERDGPVDATASTTDRRPDGRTAAERRPRRRVLVVGAVATAVVVGGIIAMLGDDGSSVQIVDRPVGPTAIADLAWPVGDVGVCLVQRGEALDAVPCAQPHDLQRIAVGTLDGAAFPLGVAFDAEAVRSAVRSACADAFESFVGEPLADSELEAPFSTPSPDTWQQGDRVFQCLVGVSDRRLIGDAESSSR